MMFRLPLICMHFNSFNFKFFQPIFFYYVDMFLHNLQWQNNAQFYNIR